MSGPVRDHGPDLGERSSSRSPTPGRSRNMAAIHRADTRPERLLRSALHARGLRFRKDLRLSCGQVRPRPDIVFTRAKVAVFVDGCFWHSCPQHSSPPKVNTDYWGPKLRATVERDRRHDLALHQAGWKVIRVWEHEDLQVAVDRILEALGR